MVGVLDPIEVGHRVSAGADFELRVESVETTGSALKTCYTDSYVEATEVDHP